MAIQKMWRLAVIAAMLIACLDAASGQRINGAGLRVLGTRPPDQLPPEGQVLETREPNGKGQQPAFAGQTRAVYVKTKTAYSTKVIAHGLDHPWGLAFLPTGHILVTQKSGSMVVLDSASGAVLSKVEGLPKVVYMGDAGLLDVVLDPSFVSNRTLYFTYVEPRFAPPTSENRPAFGDNGLAVAKAQLSANEDRLDNLNVILRVEPSFPMPAHYGSRLLFTKNDYLLVSVGERFFYPSRGLAQSLFAPFGKILCITTDGAPAPGNPFDKDQTAENHPLATIWTYGHRNPQGLAINPATGDVWESEHGPQGGDEINLIEPGKNYGWPVIAYGTNYDGTLIDGTLERENGSQDQVTGAPGKTAAPGMEQPRYYWDPAIAPSGITFYDGKLIPEWQNNLFVAALAGQHVSRLILKDNKVVGEERLLMDQHQRMRDVQEGPDGALWVVTDEADGRLIRIAP